MASCLTIEYIPSPAPSSQSILLEIADSGIRDPIVHLLFTRARGTVSLALTIEITRTHGLAQNVASFFPNVLKSHQLLYLVVLLAKWQMG